MIVTLLLIAITCAISFTCFENRKLLDSLLFWPPAVRHGEYWRFVTHGFVHADVQHLLFNMITLYFFGRAVETFFISYIGMAGFALFYLGAIVVAMVPSWLTHRDNPRYRSLGASGAVSAVLFVFIFMAPWSTIFIFVLPVPAIIFAALYVGYSFYASGHRLDNVNHSAHMWGAAYGIVFALVMEPQLWSHFINSLLAPLGGL